MEERISLIEQQIQDITTLLENQTHNGSDGQRLSGANLINAPQNALTPATGGSLTNGGTLDLKTSDSTILSNAITRIGQIETILTNLKFTK